MDGHCEYLRHAWSCTQHIRPWETLSKLLVKQVNFKSTEIGQLIMANGLWENSTPVPSLTLQCSHQRLRSGQTEKLHLLLLAQVLPGLGTGAQSIGFSGAGPTQGPESGGSFVVPKTGRRRQRLTKTRNAKRSCKMDKKRTSGKSLGKRKRRQHDALKYWVEIIKLVKISFAKEWVGFPKSFFSSFVRCSCETQPTTAHKTALYMTWRSTWPGIAPVML